MDLNDKRKLSEIKNYIDTNFQSNLEINALARKFNINIRSLQNKFKLYYGKSPKKYIQFTKLQNLIVLLQKPENGSANQIEYFYAHEFGYKESSGLSMFILRVTGMKFSQFELYVTNCKEPPNEIAESFFQ